MRTNSFEVFEMELTVGRFAPSPSGILHLGNLASSLLAWLDVRQNGGKLIFRMEDLDPDRSFQKYCEHMVSDLKYLGLNWDEGYGFNNDTYSQSMRTSLYEDAFEILKRKNLVYPCYCSRNQRLAASAPHAGEKHDSSCPCRYLTKQERLDLEASGKRPAWKIKVPDKTISFIDEHYGEVSENLLDGGDFIIKRSDGIFAYQLAVSFDDMDMGITRVVRGRDLLSSTAKQIFIINELGGTSPSYCHAPLLVSADGRKMSKRKGDLSMEVLREKYSAEEIIGYLSKLLNLTGGRPISANELLRHFSWDKVPENDILI